MNTDKNLLLFGSQFPQSTKEELAQTADDLGMKIIPADIGSFKSGERYCELYPKLKEQFEENQKEIEGARVHIVMTMEEDPNYLMVDVLNIVETLKEYGAASIHLVIGFTPFARQDRRFDERMVSIMGHTFPKYLRYAGVDEITLIDMHSKASEKFFTDRFGEKNVRFLSALEEIYNVLPKSENTKHAAPDGFYKPKDVAQGKARILTKMEFGENCVLQDHMLGFDKIHIDANEVEVTLVAGEAEGCDVVLIDDMADTAGTTKKAGAAAKQNGARSTTGAITHAIFSGNSLDLVTQNTADNPVDKIICMDTILNIHRKRSELPEEQQERIEILSTTPLYQQALKLAC